jgi:hypothetical protein
MCHLISPSWEPHVRDRVAGTVDRAGYACCVLDALRTRLRRRDIYAPASPRWGDPRAELMNNAVWQDQRDAPCDALALDTDPTAVLDQLTATLDAAWRETATGLAGNPDLRIEQRRGRDEIVLTPLDADDEPDSLIALRAQVEALLPEVEIADLPLEVHDWTGFLDEYTHISGTPSREPGLPETPFRAAGVRIVQHRAHPGRRPELPAADPRAAQLGGPQLPALGHPRRREHPAGRSPHPAAARPSLGAAER